MAYAANKKPGELTALTSLATDDVFVVGDTSDTSEVAKGITKANLLTDLGATFEPKKGADDNFVTDAQLVVIGNTSGTNTGDNAVNTLYSGLVTNATHTGEVTGATALTVDKTAITGKTAVTAEGTDYVLISDTSDSGNLKKALASDLAGGVADGDKGDITVSGSGATWTIDAGAVTLAKQADMATGSLVYRKTAGSGAPEVQTLATLKTDLALVTQTITNGVTASAPSEDVVFDALTLKAPLASPTFTGTLTVPVGLTGVLRADTGVVSVDSDVTDIVAAGTSSAAGKLELATDAEAVTGSDTARATTPANLVAKMSAPGAIGNTTASTGKFTSVETTGNIELGHASANTLSASGGVLSIEGVVIPTISSTNTLTNKRRTRRLTTTNAPGATPTTNTDNVDVMNFTGLGTAITSMTTNLSGTPSDGDLLEFRFTDDGTARSITWGASFAATTVALPTTTVISTMLRVGFEYSGSTWKCIATA